MSRLNFVALAMVLAMAVPAAHAQVKKGAKAQPVAEEQQTRPDFGVVKSKNSILSLGLDTCTISGRADFLEMRNGSSPGSHTQECVSKGKDDVKSAFDEVRKEFGKRKPPDELIDWRVEWTAAFDAALPQVGDTERTYLQKVGDARRAADRATVKLEISME